MIESLYQIIIENAGDAVLTVDPDSNEVLHSNKWAEKLTGLTASDCLTSVPAGASLEFPSMGWLYHVVQEAKRRRISRTCVIWHPPQHSRRKTRCLEVFATRIDDGASPIAILIRTLNSDKHIENKLWQRNRELHLLNHASCAIGRSLNPDEVLAVALEFSLEFFGSRTGVAYLAQRSEGVLAPMASRGLPRTSSLQRLSFEEGHGAVEAFLSASPVFGTTRWEHPEFPLKVYRCTASIPLQTGESVLGVLEIAADEDGSAARYDLDLLTSFGFQVGIALDNALLHTKIEADSHFDGLTGVFTRRRLESVLEDRLKLGRRYGEPFSVLMIDIDRFKAINDVYGHDVGDEVIRAVVAGLKAEIRDCDHLGRWGGEEFIAILTQTGRDEAMAVAERIRMGIAAMNFEDVAGVELPVTICVGVSCFPDHSESVEGLVRNADEAMRFAKRAGRNRSKLFDRKMKQGCAKTHRQRIALDGSGQTIRALAAALDAKDSYTANHSEAVRCLSVKIAKRMSVESDRIEVLDWAALLHDIGKVAIPDSILNKPGRLDDDEWDMIREHPRMGVLILKEAPQLLPIIPVVLHHHENFDGSGYPEGRAGERIPLLARILRVADVFMAMISARPYRKSLKPERALKEIEDSAGTLFDPDVVEAMHEVVEKDLSELVELA